MNDNTQYQAAPDVPRQNPALIPLNVLVGEWDMQASIGDRPLGSGRTIFSWVEGGAFLMQRSEAEQAEFPTATILIGRDESSEVYSLLYFDSRDVSRVYQMSLSADGVWKMWREAPGFFQRFTGKISTDGNTITARWERSSDGQHWEQDFDLVYTRVE
jgi:hypothetical protein